MPAAVDRVVKNVMASEMKKGVSEEKAKSIAYGHAVNMAKKGQLPKWWKTRKRNS